MAEREVERWITVNGQHIPIFKGESKQDAYNRYVAEVNEDTKQKQIAKHKAEADKLNGKKTPDADKSAEDDETAKRLWQAAKNAQESHAKDKWDNEDRWQNGKSEESSSAKSKKRGVDMIAAKRPFDKAQKEHSAVLTKLYAMKDEIEKKYGIRPDMDNEYRLKDARYSNDPIIKRYLDTRKQEREAFSNMVTVATSLQDRYGDDDTKGLSNYTMWATKKRK